MSLYYKTFSFISKPILNPPPPPPNLLPLRFAEGEDFPLLLSSPSAFGGGGGLRRGRIKDGVFLKGKD